MSVIDQRIVEMVFNNSNFEKNIKTSQDSLNKFKSALNFEGVADSMEGITRASKKIDFSETEAGATRAGFHISDVFEKVTRFLENDIARRIINVGKNMFNEMAIRPITQGFQEYELKMGSIQTIMAGTGESLEKVNAYLNELNTYSDKTIYSFSDMTSNIGKFTNAGVKLDDAVKAIQGVANVAAVSGANANEASRAMYNFSQALSSGAVKLIDWKSIENANMATVEFKQQLMDTAVVLGTLVETEEGYVSTTVDANGKVSDAFTSTFNFNNALSSQWMTTEVLTQTLANYSENLADMTEEEKAAWKEKMVSIGYTDEQIKGIEELNAKAFAAATEVKTWSMLIDTLKESVGSGWAQTWEIIFGDFNEAKKLWTELNDIFGEVISKSSDARNEVLGFWKQKGGRNALITSALNIVNALVSIVAPIKTAFENIIPPITGKTLLDLTMKFRNFTKDLILSDVQAAKVKFAFEGLFSIFDIGKQIVKAILKVFEPFEGTFSKIGETVLNLGVRFGVWMKDFDEYAKKTDLFGKAVETAMEWVREKINLVINTLKNLKPYFDAVNEKAQEFFSKLKDKGSDISGGALEVAKALIEKTKNGIIHLNTNLATVAEGFKKAFGWIGDQIALINMADVLEHFGKVAEAVGGVLKAVAGVFKSFFTNFIESATNGNFTQALDLINTGLVAGLLAALKKFVGSGKDVLDQIGESLEGLGGVLEGFQNKLNGEALKSIATAIGILAASILVMSTIDSASMLASVGAIGALLAMLESFFAATSATSVASRGKGTGLVGMLGLGNISGAMEFKTMAKGLEDIAIAVGILAAAMAVISDIDEEGIAKGLTAIGVLMVELGVFEKFTTGDKMMKGATGMIAVSAAILILVSAIEKLSVIPLDGLIKGVGAIGVLIAFFDSLIAVSGMFSKNMVGVGIGLIGVSTAILILVESVEKLGNLGLDVLAKGLIAIGVALGELSIALRVMPNGVSLALQGVGLLAVAAALLIVSQALENMGSMSVGEIAKSVITLGIVLAELAISLNAMILALPGAAALAVASAAILMLTPALKGLGSMQPSEIAKGLITLAGALGLVLAAGGVATIVAPGLLAMSAAFLAITASIAGVAVGLTVISVAMAALSVSVAALTTAFSAGEAVFVAAIAAIIGVVLDALPRIVEAIAASIAQLLVILAENSGPIIESIVTILHNILTAISTLLPDVLNLISQLLDGLIGLIDEFLPKIITLVINSTDILFNELVDFLSDASVKIFDFLDEFLDNFEEFVVDVTETLLDLLIDLLDLIAEKLPDFIEKGVDIIEALIKGIGDATVDLVDTGVKTIIALINGLADSIRENTPLMIEAIDNLMDAVIEAIFLYLTHFITKGVEIIQHIIQGFAAMHQAAKTAIDEVVDNIATAISDRVSEFFEIGKNILDGLLGGIKDAWEWGKGKLNGIVDGIKNMFESEYEIESPSHVMRRIGGFIMKGLELGIEDESANAINEAEEVSNSIEKVLTDIASVADQDFDIHPRITPIVDLTDVEDKASRVGGLFETARVSGTGTIQNGSADRFGNGLSNGNNPTYNFTQNNYSPKALSRIDIYRQTKNQFAMMREVAGNA